MDAEIMEDEHHIYLCITNNGRDWDKYTLHNMEDLTKIVERINEYFNEKEATGRI